MHIGAILERAGMKQERVIVECTQTREQEHLVMERTQTGQQEHIETMANKHIHSRQNRSEEKK